MIIEKAYAKINLALEVMDVKDGYHMVNNLMVPVDLYDELSFELNYDIELVLKYINGIGNSDLNG